MNKLFLNLVMLNKPMKNFFFLTLIYSLFLSCSGPDPEPGDTPLPIANGKLAIKFTDSRLETKAEMTLSNNDVFSISFNIKQGTDGSKPVKMAVYITGNPEKVGTLLLDNIHLKNTDEQTRSLEITLPTVGITVYRVFYINITDDKGNVTRKAINIIPSATDQFTSFPNITLGVQASSTNSRFSSTTGDIYTACDLDSNLNFVDISYATIGSPLAKPTLLSNPRRATLGLGTTATDKNCSGIITTGGTSVFYAPVNINIEWVNVSDFVLNSLTIPTTNQDLAIETGKIYMFQHTRTTRDGKSVVRKGLIKINSILNTTSTSGVAIPLGLVNFDVKIQK